MISETTLDRIQIDPEDACSAQDCPATHLSYYDAIAIANAWSTREDLDPCYDPLGNVIGGEDNNPYLCEGYRLPTEAEWEYAYRAQTSSPWYCGDNPECTETIGWSARNAGGQPQPVGSRGPNLWGLYDMAGNVKEWVHDYDSEPPRGGVSFFGPRFGAHKILKGGSWADAPEALRFFSREAAPLETRANAGLRLARSLAPLPPSLECEIDEEIDESVRVVQSERGSCQLTSGVPCTYDTHTERCLNGCAQGKCRAAEPYNVALQTPQGQTLSRPLRFLPVSAGAFAQGELSTLPGGDGWTSTTVLTHDFWLAETELTQEQAYALFDAEDAVLFGANGEFKHFDDDSWAQGIIDQINYDAFRCGAQGAGCAERPMLGLDRERATRLVNKLSEHEGLPPCYDNSGNVIDGGPEENPYLCEGYRLPTEAEWEYAYRAGTTTPYHCGEIDCADDVAWHNRNAPVPVPFDDPESCPCIQAFCPFAVDNGQSCLLPREVGRRFPNAWGFYDMAGNVAEWVHDWSARGGDPADALRDPYRNRALGLEGVLRGSSAFYAAENQHAAARRTFAFSQEYDDISVVELCTQGVRFARTIPVPTPTMIALEGPSSAGDFTLTHDFEIASTEVTHAQYRALLDDTPGGIRLFEDEDAPWGYRAEGGDPEAGEAHTRLGGCPNCPVEHVSWLDATRYANALSRRQGLQPCYSDEGEVIGVPDGDPYGCEGYRLPTEAEWEFAYQVNAEGLHCVGAEGDPLCLNGEECGSAVLPEIAWHLCNAWFRTYFEHLDVPGATCNPFEPERQILEVRDFEENVCGDIFRDEPHWDGDELDGGICLAPREVAQSRPNCLGIYDMAGNVREWVHDAYDRDSPPVGDDPWGPPPSSAPECFEGQVCRGVRGGGWNSPPVEIDGTLRGSAQPQTRSSNLGFRVARTRLRTNEEAP